MRRWIAEGYCRDANQEQEETALEMFRQLVKMNVILQHIWSEIVIMPLCRLNGFFREYMKSKSMEEDLVFALEGRYSRDLKPTGRHLTVGKKWDRNEIEFKRINQFRLRSLTVYGRWESFLISRSMRVLRVLDLEGTSGVRDVDVENMVTWLPRLRFLSLRGCRDVTHLPKSLADLTLLETLDIRGTSISKLPKTIVKLKKLRYIRAGTLAQLCDDTCTSHTEAAAVENSSPPSITVQSMPPTKPVAPEGSNTPSSSVIESIPPPPPPPPQPMVTASASSSIAGESLPEPATTVTLTESSPPPAVAAEAATTRVSSSSATVPPSTVSTGRQQRCSFLSKFSKSTEVAGSHKGGVTVPKEVFDELFALHTLGVVNISGVGCKATFEGLKYLVFLHKLGVSGINPSNSQEFFGAISGLMRLQSLTVELDKDNQAGCFDNTSMPPNSLESLKLSGITECEMPEWISELPVLRKLSLQVMKLLRNENFIICKSKVPKKLEILRLCLTGGGEFRFHRNEKIFMMQQFVNDPGYLKVLDIACNSKLKAIKSPHLFAPHIKVLKFRCCGVKSSLYFCDQYLHREGHHDNPIRRMMRLEEVWLGGTYDVAFKEYLESGIASSYSRRKPVLRLVEELLI
jgi:Leucine-rich repeat (LRR) protein